MSRSSDSVLVESGVRVLLVDDEPAVRLGVGDFLQVNGMEVEEADDCAAAEQAFARQPPDVALIDFRLPDGDALGLLKRLKHIDASVPIVVLTAHGSIDLAVQAMKLGAEQFLTKPVDLPVLLEVIRRALESGRARRRRIAGKAVAERAVGGRPDPFFGECREVRELAVRARDILVSDSPVLILGETGSGKGVLARWLHENGPRREEPFVDLNCAGLQRELLESELFGYERGAFTGAVTAKSGLMEIAHKGTLFLDEIGDMDPALQPKLLKALEEKRLRRLGDVKDRRVDFRLIAATHVELARRVEEGAFRADLYYRISTLPLEVPPLRKRGRDVVQLAERLLAELGTEVGRPGVALGADAGEALMQHGWPGNVRELRNVLERALLLSRAATLRATDLVFDSIGASARSEVSPATDLTLREAERQHIERVLAECGGQVEKAARCLGIARSSLYDKLRRLRK